MSLLPAYVSRVTKPTFFYVQAKRKKKKQIIRQHFHWITLHFNYDNYAGSTIYHELSKKFGSKSNKKKYR